MHIVTNPQLAIVSLLWAVVFSAALHAQEPPPMGPLQPSDTSSPAATLNSLIDSCNTLHELINDGAMSEQREGEILPVAERILDCLNLSELPKELRLTAGIDSALFLKEVLDRIDLPTEQEILAALETADDSPALESWQIPQTRMSIARVTQGPRQNAWLFTPDTVRNASQYYRIVKELPYREDGPMVSAGFYDSYINATKKRPAQTTADTSSPRGTLSLFLDGCNELHEQFQKDRYLDRNSPEFLRLGQQVISCLDTSQLPDFTREYFDAEAAVCLKEVLDRIPLPAAEEIPGIESVETADGSEAVVRWQVPRTQIVISKIDEGPRRGEFLFSSETVSRAPEFYRKTQVQPYRSDGRPVSEGFYDWWLSRPANPRVAAWVDSLPTWFQDRFFGMAVWQWMGLLLVLPVSLAVILITLRLGRNQGETDSARGSLIWHWLGLIFPVIAILVPIVFKHVAWEYLTLRGRPIYVANFCADVVLLMGIMLVIVRTSSRVAESFVALPGISPRGLDANLIRIICRVLGIAAAIIVFLEGGRYLGFPLTTLIASAGIGGLAIALSAQGLIKGLFGTVTILMDKPYGVGQRIIVLGHDGVVEEIGLRSTKLRALDNRLVAIPNDQMADAQIENIGDHTHLRRKTNIQIPIDTPGDKVEEALKCICAVLDNHEGMDPEKPPLVHFTEFNPNSFNIRVIYWFTPANLRQFNKFSEKVNLQIMRVFEERGIQFSLPLRHTYWKHDDQQGPLDITIHDKAERSSS